VLIKKNLIVIRNTSCKNCSTKFFRFTPLIMFAKLRTRKTVALITHLKKVISGPRYVISGPHYLIKTLKYHCGLLALVWRRGRCAGVWLGCVNLSSLLLIVPNALKTILVQTLALLKRVYNNIIYCRQVFVAYCYICTCRHVSYFLWQL